MKYLARFLEIPAQSPQVVPTEPTKPTVDACVGNENLGHGAYETDGTSPVRWDDLSEMRWGDDPDPSPEINIPAIDWRWEVASWPHDRWVAWRRRADAILAEADALIEEEYPGEVPRADADEIRTAERLAFDEMTSPSVFAGPAINF